MTSPPPAAIFAALGDATRLALLVALRSGGTRSIARLAAATAMTRQAVTKHLQVLERVGLLEVQRHGRETHYVYRPEALDGARAYLDAIGGRWDAVQAAVRPAAD